MEPAARAGRMISEIDWPRSANMRAISAAGAMGPRAASDLESSRMLRMRSPRAVPPGLRMVMTWWPSAARVVARRRSCVVFPEPSRPSKVMKYPRGIATSLPRRDRKASCCRGLLAASYGGGGLPGDAGVGDGDDERAFGAFLQEGTVGFVVLVGAV